MDQAKATGEQAAAMVHETHIGVVLLLGDRAYELKKPVRTPFLDFSTPEWRSAAPQRELQLNLGLARVSEIPGKPAEHLLVMRRMSGTPPPRRCATTAPPAGRACERRWARPGPPPLVVQPSPAGSSTEEPSPADTSNPKR